MKLSFSTLLLSVSLATTLAEPPVPGYSTTHEDSFAPPPVSAPSASYGPPSSSYGPPTSGRFGGNRQTTAILRPSPNYGVPSSSYGVPDAPSTSYGTPSGSSGNFRGSASYRGGNSGSGFSRGGFSSGGFTSGGFSSGSSSGGFSRGGFSSGSSSGDYSSGGFSGGSSIGGYSSGGHSGFSGSGYSGNRGRGSFRPSSSYGAPSGGFGGYDDGSSEPASYKFSYHVLDAPSGNDFGHQETREGHVATGMYMVLLPDGRRQIVEYVADESGYHPTVRYEGTATGGGYPSGPSGGGSSGGYRY